MSILNVEHLSHGFGDRAIFQDVSFRLLKGEHIGLIGANGEGKSTFMSQLVVEAIDQNYPVFVYSGELTDYHFKNWLDFQAAGSKNIIEGYNRFREPVYHISDEIIKKLNSWYRGRAYIYDNNSVDENEMESLA